MIPALHNCTLLLLLSYSPLGLQRDVQLFMSVSATVIIFFYIYAMHLDTNKVLFPTDAQVNCLENNFKIYIKIYIKAAPMLI
jgi:hypothetical protein